MESPCPAPCPLYMFLRIREIKILPLYTRTAMILMPDEVHFAIFHSTSCSGLEENRCHPGVQPGGGICPPRNYQNIAYKF